MTARQATVNMVYLCKHVAPFPSVAVPVYATSPEEAAQEFHFHDMLGASVPQEDGSIAYFSVIDVDGVENS